MSDRLIEEARRLAEHSLRLRLHLELMQDNPAGFVPGGHWLVLARLVETVKQERGESNAPGSSWGSHRRPFGHWEGEAYLRQSEFVHTPWHEQFYFDGLATAGRRLPGDKLVAFVAELVRRGAERGVPLYPAHMGLEADCGGFDDEAYMLGLSLGCCVQMASCGIDVWPRASLEWLDHHAEAAVASSRVACGLMIWPRWPGFYQLLDEDGMPLSVVVVDTTGERLL